MNIKNKWFQLSTFVIIFICGLSISYYFFYILPKRENLEKQIMCADKAQKYFQNNYPSTPEEKVTYTCHYNQRLNKCFIQISGIRLNSPGITEMRILLDMYENKEYGTFMQTDSLPPLSCSVQGKHCESIMEYTSLVTPYMEN